MIARIRDGDLAAVRELFTRHSGPLLGYAFCLLRDQPTAEAVVQEVFLELYRNRERCDPKALMPAVLYRAVTCACLETLDAANGSDCWRHPAAVNTETSAVATALGRLSPRQRAAFLLSRMRGLDSRDVAECLGVAPETVKSLVRGATGVVLDELRRTPGALADAR
ncbi:MAG: RNA polymerase sigma factor [Candidatus Binatia bacterium]